MRMLVLAGLLAIVGCGDSDKEAGPGGDEFCQAGFDEATTAALTAYDEQGENNWVEQPLDLTSCTPDPAPGLLDCDFSVQVKDFQDDEFKPELGGTTVRVFTGNRIDNVDAQCEAYDSAVQGAVCYEGVVDAQGQLTFTTLPCKTRVAVWAHKLGGTSPVTKKAAQFNHWVPEAIGSPRKVLTISLATYGLIPGIVGYAPDPALGIVAGSAEDCAGNTIENLHVNVEKGHGDAPAELAFCGVDPIYGAGTFYFINNFPHKNQKATSQDGLWSFVNVPPGPVTVYASGRRSDGSGVEANVAHVQLMAMPETITIADLSLHPH